MIQNELLRDSLSMVVAESLKRYFAQRIQAPIRLKEAGVNMAYLVEKSLLMRPIRNDSSFDWEARATHAFRSQGKIRKSGR